MNDYMRKIFYLKQIEKGYPVCGAGYVRLERKREYLNVLLCVTEGTIAEESAVCGIYEENGKRRRLELGSLPHTAGEWETKHRLMSLPDRSICDKLIGILIGDENNYWVGGDTIIPLTYSTIIGQQPKRQPDLPREQKPEEDPEDQPSLPPVEETKQVEETAELQAAEMYPFEDDEMLWCRQIEPEDFSSLPASCWRLGNNSFVLHGYYNYRHLLYASDGGKCYIGVPGQFHRKDQYLARQFGFPRFKGTKRKRTTMGDFGYWLQEVQ